MTILDVVFNILMLPFWSKIYLFKIFTNGIIIVVFKYYLFQFFLMVLIINVGQIYNQQYTYNLLVGV
jgi:hypothetical protein